MRTFEFKGKVYEIDEDDFLVHPGDWDKDFAEGMAPLNGISGDLTQAHWDIIWFIREFFLETSKCPLVHKTCKSQNLRLAELQKLFPTGYRRGACKLAGLCFNYDDVSNTCSPTAGVAVSTTQVYRVNVKGFLVDPAEWNEEFAMHKWEETKMPGSLTEKHWQIIYYLRAEFARTGKIPTIYETCGDNKVDIEEFGEIFPDGYHRGAVKIAGLSG